MSIRVLLCDDHRLFLEGVDRLLRSVPDIEIVGQAMDGKTAVRKALELHPQIILMDVQMPQLNGIEATREIARQLPDIGIILLTMFEDTDSVLSAMRAGARGYILKDADEEELVRSIRAVANGEALFGPAVAKRLLTYLATANTRPTAFPELTDREREVLTLIAKGLSNQEVADRMGLSLKTARNHISNILNKLQVSDRAEAIARAKAAGLDK